MWERQILGIKKGWRCERWGKRAERNREASVGLSATPVVCWQSGNRVGPMPLSSQHHGDDPWSEPQNDYKSRLLEWELNKWEPALSKPHEDPVPAAQRERKVRHHTLIPVPTTLAHAVIVLCVCMSPSTSLLSGVMAEGGSNRHPREERLIPSTCRRDTGGKHSVLFLSTNPSLSALRALSSSWPLPFVCLSGDNGRLSVTQGLTQIRLVRRRTGSGLMGISRCFTHGTDPPRVRPALPSQGQGRSLARVFDYYCWGTGWLKCNAKPAATSSLARFPLVGCRLIHAQLHRIKATETWLICLLVCARQKKNPLNFVVGSQMCAWIKNANMCANQRKSPVALPTVLHRYGYQGRSTKSGAGRRQQRWRRVGRRERNNKTEIYIHIRL